MTLALQLVEPTVVSAMRTLEIVMAFILQVAIMKDVPSDFGLIGASLVMFGVFFIPMERLIVERMPLGVQRFV